MAVLVSRWYVYISKYADSINTFRHISNPDLPLSQKNNEERSKKLFMSKLSRNQIIAMVKLKLEPDA